MGTALDIHAVSLADLSVLAALRRPDEEGGAPIERMAAYLADQHHPQGALLPRSMWGAWSGASAVGFIAGHRTQRFGCDGELQWLYVAPDYRRAGVASQLLTVLADWFAAMRAYRVCVNASEPRARTFYSRRGASARDAHWMEWLDIRSARAPSAGKLDRVAG